jgi:valyl-tRNA synthetase
MTVLKNKEIKFYPEIKKDQLIKYLEGIKDWNISRQIPWGIPIPAFQNIDDPDDWIFDDRVTESVITFGEKKYHRDPDVFDTWFSSSSWPYVVLNYPDGKEFRDFYPLSVMETGGEILYPWVSRMIMLGLYVTGEIPFKSVYIHGYVLAQDGAKMSKSIGNVIDPVELVNEFGSDALRMGIIANRVPAVNRGYDVRTITEARNFCNKLWNLARFIEDKSNDSSVTSVNNVADSWILMKLAKTADSISKNLDNYIFAEAYNSLYHFVWDDFADWYIEVSKSQLNREVLTFILKNILRLAHPFAPFITEVIWQKLIDPETLIATNDWPREIKYDTTNAKVFDTLKSVITEVRYIKHALNLKQAELHHLSNNFIKANGFIIEQMTKVKTVEAKTIGRGIGLTQSSMKAWIPADKTLVTGYIKDLNKKRDLLSVTIKNVEKRLANKSYVKNAPKQVVDQSLQQLSSSKDTLKTVNQEIERFSSY